MITVRQDTVAGHPCLIFYDGTKAIATLWHDESMNRDFPFTKDIHQDVLEASAKLVVTMRALGLPMTEVTKALQTLLTQETQDADATTAGRSGTPGQG